MWMREKDTIFPRRLLRTASSELAMRLLSKTSLLYSIQASGISYPLNLYNLPLLYLKTITLSLIPI